MTRWIAPLDLERAMLRALAPFGAPPQHDRWVVDTLLSTSLDGIDTHGVRLLPVYVRELAGGRSKARPELAVHGAAPAMALLDADHALGPVAANAAIDLAIERAQALGIAGVAVRNSNHFGAAGYYTVRAASAGLIALAFSHADALVAPFGGAVPLLGTNPIAMAAPGQGELFRLDMATSQISYSQVLRRLEQGEPLEPGWANDESGADASSGGGVRSLRPLGGYKGQGLAMMVQILAGLLAGMPFDHELSHLYAEPYDTPRQIGHLFVCIDVRAVCEPGAFRARVSALLDALRRCPPSGDAPVIAPGDKERDARALRSQRGVPLQGEEWDFFAPFFEGASAGGSAG